VSTGTATARRHLTWVVLVAVPVAFLALFFAWPLVVILARGLGGTSAADAWDVLSNPVTADAVLTTVLLAGLGTLGSLLMGVPGAYVLHRLRWRGQRTVRALVTVPFVLPTVVVATAFTALLGRRGPWGFLGIEHSAAAIILALVFFNVAVVVRIVGARWEGLDPSRALAARTLGATRWRALRTVTLPALGSAIASATAAVFLFCSTSFALVLILGGTRVRTVETEIYMQVNVFLDLHAAAVLALVQVAIVGLALALVAWVRRGADAIGAGRELDGSRPATKADAPLMIAVLAPLALLLVAPMVALVMRSLTVTGGERGLGNYVALIRPPAQTVLPVSVAEAAMNSLITAAIATALVCLLAVPITAAAYRGPRWARALDGVAMAPLGVSSVVVGLGLLLTLNTDVLGVDLRASWWLVPIAQALVALPLAVRVMVPAARAIDERLSLVAASLGASPWRAWRTVDAALLRGPVALALAFAFAIALGEFGATAFVARPDRPTLPTAIARLLSRPGAENVGMAFAAAVLLALLVATVMLAAERIRTRVRMFT
jgi:thiamine transport system permease protein